MTQINYYNLKKKKKSFLKFLFLRKLLYEIKKVSNENNRLVFREDNPFIKCGKITKIIENTKAKYEVK